MLHPCEKWSHVCLTECEFAAFWIRRDFRKYPIDLLRGILQVLIMKARLLCFAKMRWRTTTTSVDTLLSLLTTIHPITIWANTIRWAGFLLCRHYKPPLVEALRVNSLTITWGAGFLIEKVLSKIGNHNHIRTISSSSNYEFFSVASPVKRKNLIRLKIC